MGRTVEGLGEWNIDCGVDGEALILDWGGGVQGGSLVLHAGTFFHPIAYVGTVRISKVM